MRALGRARAAIVASVLAPILAPVCVGLVCLVTACVNASPPSVAPAAATAAAGVRVLASYRAPLGCPTQQEYLGYVASRAARLQLVPQAQVESAMLDAATRVRVRIQPDSASAGWIGSLRIEGPQALEREVRGERCQDVSQALALITVLRLDERAGEAPGAPPSAAAERAGGELHEAEPAPAAPAPAPAAPAAATSAEAAPLPEAVPATHDPEPSEQARSARGLDAEAAEVAASAASAASAPAAQPEVARANVLPPVEREVDLGARAGRQSGRALQPLIVALGGYAAAPSHALQAQLLGELQLGRWVAGLGAGYSVASESNSDADLDFQLFTAQLALCPVGGELSVFWWRACAKLEGGALRVSVSARDPSLETQSSTRPWFALGPSLQAGWPFASQWALRAGAGGSLMLVRDRFEVERAEGGEGGEIRVEYSTLYRPPPLSFELLFGVSYAF
jgi:hypothetical protein